jgi:hypothetical protein
MEIGDAERRPSEEGAERKGERTLREHPNEFARKEYSHQIYILVMFARRGYN